jgi:hypothetical protein
MVPQGLRERREHAFEGLADHRHEACIFFKTDPATLHQDTGDIHQESADHQPEPDPNQR